MSNLFTANRVVALGSLGVSLGSVAAAFAGVFPLGWENAILAVAGVLAHSPTVVTFLLGAQKSEKLQAKGPPADALAQAIAANRVQEAKIAPPAAAAAPAPAPVPAPAPPQPPPPAV